MSMPQRYNPATKKWERIDTAVFEKEIADAVKDKAAMDELALVTKLMRTDKFLASVVPDPQRTCLIQYTLGQRINLYESLHPYVLKAEEADGLDTIDNLLVKRTFAQAFRYDQAKNNTMPNCLTRLF